MILLVTFRRWPRCSYHSISPTPQTLLSIPELAKALAPELARHLVPLLVQELDHRQAERLRELTDDLGARVIQMTKEELLPPIRESRRLVTMETKIRRDFDRGQKKRFSCPVSIPLIECLTFVGFYI